MIEETRFSAEFLDRLIEGDLQAFNEMVESTSAGVYHLGLRMLGDQQDAEDMLQETYLKAHKALADFEKRSSIKTWLFRIATNEALMMLRKRKSNSIVDIENTRDEDNDTGLELVDWCCLPESEFLSGETREVLDQASKTLTAALRTVFLLRDVHGFSTSETAEILQINEDAVKTRLVRARSQLREKLGGYFRDRMESIKGDG